MQKCAHGRRKGDGRIRNDVVALIKQVAPEVVSIHCVILRSISGQEARQWKWNFQLAGVISGFRLILLFPGFDWYYYIRVSIKIVNAILPWEKSWDWWTWRGCVICDRNFLCGFMDEKITKLFHFTDCLACCSSLFGDIFNHQKLFEVVELTYSKQPPKSHC